MTTRTEIVQGDCLDVLPTIASGSVDLIVTDPPYFRVKALPWDRQWDSAGGFLAWLGKVADEWQRVLAPNGSLYAFASPQMAARVELLLAERFTVLNHVTWVKENGWHRKAQPADLRSYFPQTERVVFCEQFGADGSALRGSGYAAECQKLHAGVFEPLRQYLESERQRAGVDKVAINVACGFSASPGGMAARHYFSGSQWCLPTREHYEAMQRLFNERGNDYLRREYEDLRREYEDLRREYEDLRRPFTVTSEVPYTDVWTYPTVSARPGKHPCEKPIQMLRDIVSASSRPGGLVLDSFAGSGATGQAAQELGRRFVGIEMDPAWAERARERLAVEQPTLMDVA